MSIVFLLRVWCSYYEYGVLIIGSVVIALNKGSVSINFIYLIKHRVLNIGNDLT